MPINLLSETKKPMRVLVACEESQTVCKAFRAKGHKAYSCDILPCSGGHPGWHIQGDCVAAILSREWDMIIMHPPCTCIALCGNSTYGVGMSKHDERLKAINWTTNLWNTAKSVCSKVMLENPKNVMGRHIGQKSQSIQPYQFGHTEQKETWLWLHGLSLLKETNNVYDEMMKLPKNQREDSLYVTF